MRFGDVLTGLMAKYNVRSVDICNALDIKKSYFSKLKNGKLCPSDYKSVTAIADHIGIDSVEYRELSMAYLIDKLGSEKESSYHAFNRLYDIELPHCTDIEPLSEELSSGKFISGTKMLEVVLNEIAADSRKLRLLFLPDSDELCITLHNVITGIAPSVVVEWLVPLEKAAVSDKNLSTFGGMIPILTEHSTYARGLYTDLDSFAEHSAFPFIFIGDDKMMIFSNDSGVFFNYRNVVDLYRKRFDESFVKSVPFAGVFTDIELFLENYKMLFRGEDYNDSTIYIIDRYPCIVMEVSQSELRSHINMGEDSYRIADLYNAFLQKTSYSVSKVIDIFSNDGLDHFINDDTFHEFDGIPTENISSEIRMKALNNMIDFDNHAITPLIMKMYNFNDTSLKFVNVLSSGEMLLYYNFGSSICLAVLNEKSVTSAIIGYLKAMIKCGIIASEEDSADIIRRMSAEKTVSEPEA